jgi:hypothetical protein
MSMTQVAGQGGLDLLTRNMACCTYLSKIMIEDYYTQVHIAIPSVQLLQKRGSWIGWVRLAILDMDITTQVCK